MPVCFRKLELDEALRLNVESYQPGINEKCETRSLGFRVVSCTKLMLRSFSFSSKYILIVCSKEMIRKNIIKILLFLSSSLEEATSV